MKRYFSILMIPLWLLAMVACEGSFLKKKLDERKGTIEVKERVSPLPPIFPKPAATPAPAASPGPVPPPTLTQADTDRLLTEETNGYIECLNRTSTRTQDSRQRYLSWVSEKTGPTCTEPRISYNLYTLYEDGIEKCRKAAERGKAGEPSLPNMEQAVGEIAAAYADLVPLVQKVYDYYQQQDYKDDQCAKGKQLHPQLMATFNRYQSAEKILRKDLDKIKYELETRELARMESSSGKNLEWYTRRYLLSAKDLMNTVPNQDPTQFNASRYLDSYKKFEEDYQAFENYAVGNSSMVSQVFWFGAFQRSAKEFYSQAKFLRRNVAAGGKPDAKRLDALYEDFNRFIQDANTVRF